jgi:hypothetical protein
VASALLMSSRKRCSQFRRHPGAEWLLPLTIFGMAGADVALAALAYRHDVASTVRVTGDRRADGRSASRPGA